MKQLALLRASLVVALALTFTACARPAYLEGRAFYDSRPPEAVYLVMGRIGKSRDFAGIIAGAMNRQGLTAVTEREAAFDFLVIYEDRWAWDLRDYLADLRIDIRDADSNLLVATARSYQISPAAIGKTHHGIIHDTVAALVEASLSEDELRARKMQAVRR